jgi:hypothetical protein
MRRKVFGQSFIAADINADNKLAAYVELTPHMQRAALFGTRMNGCFATSVRFGTAIPDLGNL